MINRNKNLKSTLEYTNDDVIGRFLEIYGIEEFEAISIFEETKKWLWLCSNAKFDLIIDDSLFIIDEMWHNFLVFTKDYNEFCQSNFGCYIHHQPTTKKERENWNKDSSKSLSDYKETLKKQYELIYDQLGEETLNKWYVEFSDKYTKEYIKTITR
ncbi:MAG TPA: hypothetical protein VFS71_17660 [Flavobacterium sp.]|uniref:hypothetical protein n=1 Tax=Flavobacterium sp. TaxID=239 RepID=UPI002DB767D5|nr:hypothetical protein [Flavobacterium sp.]HEU4791519.1 hypothetical protein [Flavobacterium sp.]